jgi:hypothetical protein
METHSHIDDKFEKLRDSGSTAKAASAAAVADGMNFVEIVPMLIRVFNLDFADAKEAWLQAKGIAQSLDEYQGSLVPIIDEALSQLDDCARARPFLFSLTSVSDWNRSKAPNAETWA